MDCPLCGCPVRDREEIQVLECSCCGSLWMRIEDRLERILVGAEG